MKWFINADSAIDNRGINTQNLFAYCGNNPIAKVDSSGTAWTLNGVTYNYDGSIADFHRAEQGLSPLAYEIAVQQEKAAYAATVYAESAAYSIESKEAVAHVINNRVGTATVNGKGTRNTIMDVVSEPAQFSSYENVWYNEALTYYTTGMVENEYDRRVLKECMEVVIPIYEGEATDITEGCTYFYSPISMDPPGSQPSWVSGKTEVVINGVNPKYFRFYK